MFKKTKCFTGLMACVWFCIFSRPVASDVAHDTGYWTTTAASFSFAKHWKAGVAIQTRARDDFDHLERTVIRPSLSYRFLKDTWFTAGYDAHFIELPRDRLEQRTWQQILRISRFENFSVSGRLRLEERFVEGVDDTAYRLRLKARLDIPISDTSLKLSLSNEYFIGMNTVTAGPREGFDQNRSYVGLSHRIGDNLTAQLGYQTQIINRATADNLVVHQLMLGFSFEN